MPQVKVSYTGDPDEPWPEPFEPSMQTLDAGVSAQEGARAFFLQRPPLASSGFAFSEGSRELLLGSL